MARITHAKPQPSTARTLIRLVLLIAVPLIVIHLLIAPRVESWLTNMAPAQSGVLKAMRQQFPDKAVETNDTTFYGPDKERILTIGVIGKQHLSQQEVQQSQNIICDQLGGKAQDYSRILLLNVAEKRFIQLFYSRDIQQASVNCTFQQPGESNQPNDEFIPLSPGSAIEESLPLEMPPAQTDPAPVELPTPKDGDYQLDGDNSIKDATVTCCSLR